MRPGGLAALFAACVAIGASAAPVAAPRIAELHGLPGAKCDGSQRSEQAAARTERFGDEVLMTIERAMLLADVVVVVVVCFCTASVPSHILS